MKEKKEIGVDEINQSIIDHITNALNKFCFGEYKEETDYPEVLIKVKIESSGVKTTYDLAISLRKNLQGILQRSNISVRNIRR